MAENIVFLKGDDVMGHVGNDKIRGKVLSFDAKSDKLAIQYRGPSILHETNRMIKGDIVQTVVSASDFELIYRKPVKEKKQ